MLSENGEGGDFIPLHEFLSERRLFHQLKRKRFFALFIECKRFRVSAYPTAALVYRVHPRPILVQ